MSENEVNSPGSHSLFFAVIFMTALILVTVVGYFLFLPDRAPMQVSLAVVPIEVTSNTPKYVQHALPREMREMLALSRDVIVVDYEAAEQVFESEKPFRGFIRELGASHFVDGVVAADEGGEETLTIRLIDGTQPAWKTKRQIQFSLSSTTPIEILRDAVQLVRDGLYDTSAGPLELPEELNAAFTLYLEARDQLRQGDFDAAISNAQSSLARQTNEYAAYLLSVLVPEKEQEYLQTALTANPRYVPALVASARQEYVATRDLVAYLDKLIPLVMEFPNSDAVYLLADALAASERFQEAEQLLFRWARMRPRSSDAALALSIARYRRGDRDQSLEALKVAEARDADLQPANRSFRLRSLRRFLVLENDSSYDIVPEKDRDRSTSSNCDVRFNEAYRSDRWRTAYSNLGCVEFSYSIPPAWVNPDDQRWLLFVSDDEYRTWSDRMRLSDPRIATYDFPDANQLFNAPRD